MKPARLYLFLWSMLSLPVAAQVPATRLVTQPIDSESLVALHGTVHPFVQPRFDRGMVNESTPAARLLLLLGRPPEREAAFRQFVRNQYTPGSPDFHHWLTPVEIGSRFGPADADVSAVVQWLGASGFQVNAVSKAKRFVEFSGSVGQVNAAFHTEIHEYMVNGVLHHANATGLRIPQALSGIVAGLSPLHDFRPAPQFQETGRGHYDASAHQLVPDFNLPSSWNPLLYGVVPADFYTQYDLNPLYAANVTGAGVTIGVIDASNIDLSLASAYRSVFGLGANQVQVVLDGGDPGENTSDVEAYLDVELAGAAAPGATVDLYLSAGSPYQDPLALAAVRAVEDDRADVLSLSWGAGEEELEGSGNLFWNAIWEQAAAQGQTALVSAGDYGQIPDEEYLFSGSFQGPAVNGMASTPWNIAVGGTDFYYADYAAGAPSASTFWKTANDPVTKGSLETPIAEQPWNDPFGLDAISTGLLASATGAGSGGASNCTALNSANSCAGGYSKPSWQTGPGVPADGARDLPDVALFASNGYNYSGWVLCDYEGACAPDASGNFGFDVVGGTSASAPAMAGIIALVVQKYGRQGQADAVLYPLAQQKPAAFHDITVGGNWDICIQGDQDCALNVAGLGADAGKSTVYSAGPGYDQASGLGSVDAAQLVNDWNAIAFASTSTTLQVTPSTAVHGTNVSVTTTVTQSSGSGTPTGAVAILTNATLPSNAGQTAITLNAGTGSASLNFLPGGIYQLTARYGGDGQFAPSTSEAQPLTITQEKSNLNLAIEGQGSVAANALTYGVPVILSAQPVGVNSPKGSTDGAATGSITFTLDKNTATAPLNVGGIASWTAPAVSVGAHTASASYSGDASFQASSAQAQNLNVGKGQPWMDVEPSIGWGNTIYTGSSVAVGVIVGTVYGPIFSNTGPAPPGTLAPTGTVAVKLVWDNSDVLGIGCGPDNTGLAQTANLSSPDGVFGQYASATVVFPSVPARASGYGYMLCAQYNGDANWESQGLIMLNEVNVTPPPAPLTASTTTLTITPSSIAAGQNATITATVSGPAGSKTAPTGTVMFTDNGTVANWLNSYGLVPAASGDSASFTLFLPPQFFWANGANQITAVYSGDGNYLSSTSSAVTVNVAQGGADFTLAAQSPQITVASGGTGTLGLNLTPVNNFSGTVSLTCAPSSSQFSCSVSPSSTPLSGPGSSTLTIAATIPGVAANAASARNRRSRGLLAAGAALAFCLGLFLPFRQRRRIGFIFLLLLAPALYLAACGGVSGGGGGSPPVNGTPPGAYSVVVTGTANGIVHNDVVYVVVQ